MKKKNDMKKLINISENTTLALCLISLCGLVFNIVFYVILRITIINNEDIMIVADKIEVFLAIVFIIFFIFHISAIFSIILQLKFFKRESILRSFSFFVSVISLLMIFGDFALLSDISKEYIGGIKTGIAGEFLILYLSQGLHLLFLVLVIVLTILTKRRIYKKAMEEIVIKDESIFINANYIGVLCSVSGLGLLILLSIYSPLWAIKKGIIAITLMIMLPYIAIAVYWAAVKFKEKAGEWYDEKQYQDLAKASLTTWIVSVILLAVIFAFQYWYSKATILNVIWFPLYLFFSLLIFSSSILYLSKKDMASEE
ncbi:MAG: hypothetical protein PHR39_02980 [Actinomycetota bacterium]|nr:hypothetical protein [Actinomycetota bacterium]